MPCAIAQQTVQFRVLERRAQAAADYQKVQLLERMGLQLTGHQFQAQVAQHSIAVQRQRRETEAVAAQQVRRHQHIHGHGEAGHREMFQQDEANRMRHRAIGGGWLEAQHVGAAGFLAELTNVGHGALRG